TPPRGTARRQRGAKRARVDSLTTPSCLRSLPSSWYSHCYSLRHGANAVCGLAGSALLGRAPWRRGTRRVALPFGAGAGRALWRVDSPSGRRSGVFGDVRRRALGRGAGLGGGTPVLATGGAGALGDSARVQPRGV